MKILSIDNMIGAAEDSDLPDIERHVQAVEQAATELAEALAKHHGIGFQPATWEGEALAGCCAPFFPLTPNQPCPEPIDTRDEGGDWEHPGVATYNPDLN